MSQLERLKFFRAALSLCARWNRSPQVARVINGRGRTLREVMILVGEGEEPPAITADEARTLAGEFTGFDYGEILAGLSSGRAARASRTRSGRQRGRSGLTPGGSCRAPRVRGA